MLNRREFVKRTLSAGLVMGAGSMCYGCSGLTRRDMSAFQETNGPVPVLDSTTKTILYHAGLAPSGHNSQPWRVRVERADLWIVEADAERRLPAVDPENRECLLSLGAFVENLSLAAGAMGWETDMQVMARARHDRDVVRVTLRKGRPTRYPLGRIKARRTVKNGLLPREIAVSQVKTLSQRTGGRLFYFPRGSKHALSLIHI